MWKIRQTHMPPSEQWGFIDMIKETKPISSQGANSLMEYAFDSKGKKLPIICKTVPLYVNVDKLVTSQNLASSFGIAPRIYEVHENNTHYRIIMEFVNAKTLSSIVNEYGFKIITKEIKMELYVKITTLYHLKIEHHDLHSDNILLEKIHGTDKYKVVIIDFDDVGFPVVVNEKNKVKEIEIKHRTMGMKFMVIDDRTLETYRMEMKERFENMPRTGNAMIDKSYDRMALASSYF
jgi:tRNA A-37 threonylcarbamoyl transferase component Bud32